MQTTTPIIEKLQKLIRMAASSNENESQQAMMRAQELAIKNNIDIATIDEHEGMLAKKIEITKDHVSSGQRFCISQRYTNWILTGHFGVRIVLSGNRNLGRVIAIIGDKEDVEFAKYLISFLNETFMRLWKEYRAKTNTVLNNREPYIYALYRGLNQKLEENKTQIEQEFLGDARTQEKYQLAIVSKQEKVDDAVGVYYPSLKKAVRKYVRTVSENIIQDGINAGRNIKISKALA